MRRAQSMAQAAWSRPSMDISSWACMGPRRRAINAGSPESSSCSNAETQSISTTLELPVSSSNAETAWHSEELQEEDDDDDDAYVARHEDRMTEFELWEKLEQELYDNSENEEETDVAKEMREEEEAAIAQGSEIPSNEPEKTKEAHRFFPAGRIMHIVSIPHQTMKNDESSSSSSSSDTDDNDDSDKVVEDKVGIYLTPRSLYSKIRLSHDMIADHFMPVYRRQIEKLIQQLEKEDTSIIPQTHI